MNTHEDVNQKETVSIEYIKKHRPELRRSIRERYALSRIALVVYGGIIALFYLLSPLTDKVSVQDFSLNIFIAMLALFSLSELMLRVTEYSCEIYTLSEKNTGGDCEKGKDPFFVWLAFRVFPFRDIHKGLLSLWFFLAIYYLIVCGVKYDGITLMCPENFPLSFYAVVGTCIFDFIIKEIFIFRIPGLGGLMAEFTNAAIHSDGRGLSEKALDGFFRILQKLSFKKGR